MGSQVRYFQPASDDTPNTNEWHAYRDESAAALCGEAQLSYNRDKVADEVPTDGALHDGCRQAIDAENPAGYTPHPDDAVEETDAVASDETDGGETPTTESTEADPSASSDGQPVPPPPPAPDSGEPTTETQEVTSGDVADASTVLGGDSNTGDQPPADQPPADQPQP